MKRREFFLLLALQTIARIAPCWGQEFRVELFPGSRVETLLLRAGRDPVSVCSLAGHQNCLRLMPGDTARCVTARESIRCASPAETERFERASVVSSSPFRMEAGARNVRRDAPPRAVALNAVEVMRSGYALRVTATLGLETYVTGVLGGEASTLTSPAALCAMAVVARTWALGQRGRHRSEGFDFCSLTHCQVFRLPSETASEWPHELAVAARSTRGQVLRYRDRQVDLYFTANCGGVTEAARDVWPDRDEPYLVSVTDPYCAGKQHSSWRSTLSLETLSAIVRDDLGVPLRGPLRAFAVEARDASGRARTLYAQGGREQRIDANQFRYAVNRRLGWNTLKSNLYSVERRQEGVVFRGRGLGHGVGLCQAGAEQMGQMGIAYDKILATYFPGTTLALLSPVEADPIVSSEHFELFFPASQESLAGDALQVLENSYRELGPRASVLPARIRVQTWETTGEFIRATGQPGWAAASNDGRTIGLQPLETLRRKGILRSTLRHELTHLVVHRLRAREVPVWFEEGLVLYLTGERVLSSSKSHAPGRSLEETISKPRSEAEMRAAYAEALRRVNELARLEGEPALWRVLEHPAGEDLRRLKRESW